LKDNSYKAVNLLWGLVPSWSKDTKIGHRLINARAETVSEKPSFRAAFKQRRCLIPATGFYEWLHQEDKTFPYHICNKDQTLFAFAGLWEHCDLGQETIYTCTIITTVANELIQPIHERMPVIIRPEHYKNWLDKSLSPNDAQQLLVLDAYENMHLIPVSNWVNNPQHNDQRCLY
jgi:putative SOS response-associated peptidase YedK